MYFHLFSDMCIHDQCDTILVSVDQRIIMPRSPPLRAQQTVQSEHQHYQPRKLSKTSSWPGQATRQPGQARGEAWPVSGKSRAGPLRVECPLLRRPWASYTARHPHPTRPGLGGERERRLREPTRGTKRRPRPRGEPRGSVRCTEPGRSIPGPAHCQFTHDKPFRVRSCPYWSSWVASSWLSSSQPNLSGCSSRDHSLWPSSGLLALTPRSQFPVQIIVKQANTPPSCPAHTASTRGEVKHAKAHSEAEDPIESGAVNFEARVKTAWKVGSQSKDKYAPRLQPALTNLGLKPLYLSSSNASAHTSGSKFRLSFKDV